MRHADTKNLPFSVRATLYPKGSMTVICYRNAVPNKTEATKRENFRSTIAGDLQIRVPWKRKKQQVVDITLVKSLV